MDYAWGNGWGIALMIGIPFLFISISSIIWSAKQSKKACEEWERKKARIWREEREEWERKKAQIWREELERKEEEQNDDCSVNY